MVRSLPMAVALAAMTALAGPALAAGDPAAGEKVFAVCRACHTTAAGINRLGPSLHGLFGRPAGSVPDYAYSPAMKAAGAAITWNEDTLDKYLKDPRAFVPDNKMPFLGVKDDADRADLIAYLKQATQ